MSHRRLSKPTICLLAGSVLLLCAQQAASPHGAQIRALMVLFAGAACLLAAVAMWRVGRELLLGRRLHHASKPGEVNGVAIRRLHVDAPFVAGIIRPTIYWPADVPARLSERERRAVVLHEEHHRRHAAPRRLLVLGVFGTLIPVPPFRRHLDVMRAQLEIEADEGALAAGATRGALASALLKLAPTRASYGAGFTTAADLRLRSLLGEAPKKTTRVSRRWAAASAVSFLSVALACLLVAG